MNSNVTLGYLQHIAVGCVASEVQNGAWHPHRIPSAMRGLYLGNEGMRVRLECASSVRLRFKSSTHLLRLRLRYGAAARPLFKGVLLVDGVRHSTYGPDEAQREWEGDVFVQATSRLRAFDLWLPHLCRADICTLELDFGAVMEPAPPLERRWLAYGDSITQGMTSSTPLESLTARCALALNAEVLNFGIGGATLDAGLANTLPDTNVDFVTIAYGTNDFLSGIEPEQFLANARKLLHNMRTKWPSCPVLLITPVTWAGRREGNQIGRTLEDYRATLAYLVKDSPGVYLVPGEMMIPDDKQYFVDSVHPNDLGFEIYSNNLLPYLRKAITSQL